MALFGSGMLLSMSSTYVVMGSEDTAFLICMQGGWGSIVFACSKDFHTGYLTSPSRRDPRNKYTPKGDGTPYISKGVFPKRVEYSYLTKLVGGTPENIDILRVQSLA